MNGRTKRVEFVYDYEENMMYEFILEYRILIKNLPKTLICHLKRFKYDERLNRMIKLFCRIAFPLEIKISPVKLISKWVSCESHRFPIKNYIPPDGIERHPTKDEYYELIAVIIHHGQGFSTGHYNVLIKKNDSWYLYDDEEIFVKHSLFQFIYVWFAHIIFMYLCQLN